MWGICLMSYDFIESIPFAIFVVNAQGDVSGWNQEAAGLFKLKADEKYNFEKIFGDAFQYGWLEKNTQWHEKKLMNKWFAFTFRSYQENYLLIVQDISHQHHLEFMRQDFVANVSHELRTPLTVLHGYLEFFLENNKENNLKPLFQEMQQQSLRMQNIIEDLLFLSQLENIEHESKHNKKVDVAVLLKTIYQNALQLSNGQHEIHFAIDETLQLAGIENELHSMFSNLIFNAVKYTPPTGKIWIRWFLKNKQPCFEVEDTGIGIAAKHIPRITERFYRIDKARSKSTGGTGLGLAIVKHILIHHQGELKIESKLNKGSKFSCLFPAIKEEGDHGRIT